jgi:ribosome-interacting GTPase 1
MPANLPPQYIAAEQKLKTAKDPEEKIAILEEMWGLLPKHKGTDKIQADIKRRISKLKDEAEKTGRRRKGFSITVEREGAGQVTILGPPNSGKSSLVSALTAAALKTAPYPFTTIVPCPAMMPYKDVQVQLVDLPPIAPGHVEFWLVNLIKNADVCLLVVDASDAECLERAEETLAELDLRHIGLGKRAESTDGTAGATGKKTLLVANKIDLDDTAATVAVLSKFYATRFEVVPFSCAAPGRHEIDALRERVFSLLGVIRIYSKEPGQKADLEQPFTIRTGATVIDFAAHVHKDFASGLKQARVWGSARFPGQPVSRDYVLKDGDIVELSL